MYVYLELKSVAIRHFLTQFYAMFLAINSFYVVIFFIYTSFIVFQSALTSKIQKIDKKAAEKINNTLTRVKTPKLGRRRNIVGDSIKNNHK